jgi:hypothetical protein
MILSTTKNDTIMLFLSIRHNYNAISLFRPCLLKFIYLKKFEREFTE